MPWRSRWAEVLRKGSLSKAARAHPQGWFCAACRVGLDWASPVPVAVALQFSKGAVPPGAGDGRTVRRPVRTLGSPKGW